MMEIIKGLYRADGFLTALAALAADRELCGDQRDSFVRREAKLLATNISSGADYIIDVEKQIRELREEVESLRGPVENIPGR